ncbi:asparagine synthetase B family protein [Algihabitans albus]|uniref:asparagine synthetase B family protein n=1 Tax=Algihabitans albus TaxID=2164067 RepID=UPI000E5D91AA|nr:asparagine synthase-related protein [Algihabitans albus]
MSRIAGLFRFSNPRPGDPAALEQMLTSLPGHNNATTICASAGLGHRAFRPSGPAGGTGKTEGLLLALDGALLNRAELENETGLEKASDIRLVASLIRRLGFAAALERLDGDFALAAFDPETRKLHLARDRLGVKPLYWSPLSDGIAFGSQPRALLTLPEVPNDLDRKFVARFGACHYRGIDAVPEASPYAAVYQIPAGHRLEASPQTAPQVRAWWCLENEPEFAVAQADELAETYRTLLFEAVRKRVATAERPIFTLSGGLDSSSVLCSATEVTGRKQEAISSVYVDPRYDERNEIQDVVETAVSRWHMIEVGDSVDLFGLVAELTEIHDEPVATATWLSHHLLCRDVAAGGFDALFGGLGGDELNAGEYEYFPLHFADLRAAGREAEVAREVAAWAHHHDHPIYRKDAAAAEQMMARLADPVVRGQCKADPERLFRYRPLLTPEWDEMGGFEPDMSGPFHSYLKNRTFQDMFRETLPCCLRAEDRQATAFGLAHHDPFLDHRLVAFMYRVPGDLKIRDGVTKQLLRRAMQGVLPEATRTRIAKTGWNAPAHRWFGGRTLEALRDRVRSTDFRTRGVFDPDAVEALLDEHAEIVAGDRPQENHMMLLWQLLNLDLWMERHRERAGAG